MACGRGVILMLVCAWAQGQERARSPYTAAGIPGSQMQVGHVLADHPHGGGLIEMSPGGHLFATTNPSGDGTVLIWDDPGKGAVDRGSPRSALASTESGPLVLGGHTEPVLCMAFAPVGPRGSMGTLFASGSEDGTVRAYRLGLRDGGFVVKGAQDWVTGVAWIVSRPDGAGSPQEVTGLATASLDGKLRWYRVRRTANNKLDITLDRATPHPRPLTSLAVDPISGWLGAGDESGDIHLWKTASERGGTLKGHTGSVGALAFDRRGATLASGSNDRSIRLWDAREGRLTHVLRGHAGWVSDVAWTPTNELVSASWDRSARIWNPETGRERDIIAWHPEPAVACGVAASGVILTGTSSRATRLWPTPSATDARRTEYGHRLPVYHAAMSGNGQWVLTASVDHSVAVWEAATGRPVTRLRGHGGAVAFVAVTTDGGRAATASSDGIVRLWDLPSGRLLAAFSGHEEPVNTCAFDGTGRWLASGGRDEKVIVWDTELRRRVRVLKGHSDDVKAVAWSPDGRTLASVADDGSLRLWDRLGKREPRVVRAHPAPLHTVAFRPDGKALVTGSLDQTLKFWSADLVAVKTVGGFGRGVNTVAWNRMGTRVIVSSSDGQARVIDGTTGATLHTLPRHQLACTWAGFDPAGHLAVTACLDGTVRQSAIATGEVLRHYPAIAGSTTDVALTAGGRAYSTHEDGRLRCWDALGGVQEWQGEGTGPVALSADGKIIATGSAESGVRLRSLPGGAPLRGLTVGGRPMALSFMSGNSSLAVLTEVGTVVVLDVAGVKKPRSIELPGQAVALTTTPDRRQLIIACRNREVVFVEPGSGRTVETVALAATPSAVAVSADGRLAVGDVDGGIEVLAGDGNRLRLDAGGGPIRGLAYDGTYGLLSSTSQDGVVRAWDAAGAVLLGTTIGRRGERPTSIAGDPRGRFMVTGTEHGLLLTTIRGRFLGAATAFDDGQWSCWRGGRLRRSTCWVSRPTATGWTALPLPPSGPAAAPPEIAADWDPINRWRLRVRVTAPSGVALRDIRLLAVPDAESSASVVVEGLVARCPGGASCDLSVTVLGDPRTARLIMRYNGTSRPVVIPGH